MTPVRALAALLALASAPLLAPPAAAQRPDADALPLAAFAYDHAAPLAARDSLLRVDRDVEIRGLRFPSPRGGDATGRLFVPRAPDGGRFAGILLQHGMPGSAATMERWGVMLARRGAVVVALDAPFARRGGPPLRFTPADSAEQVQLVTDLERAVDLLLRRPDTDSARIGYVGVSYGGAIGALLSGVERRIAAYALVVPNGGLLSHFRSGDRWLGSAGRLPAEARERWVAALRPIEPIRFVGRAAPAHLLIQSGLRDRQVPPSDARELQAAASEPKTVRWYDGGHGLTSRAERDMTAWLARELRLAGTPAATP